MSKKSSSRLERNKAVRLNVLDALRDITAQPTEHGSIDRDGSERCRNKRVREKRAVTLPVERVGKQEIYMLRTIADQLYPKGVERPRTRADCELVPRPCPFVSCKWHLYLDVNPANGSLKLNFPEVQPWEVKDSCSLDIADEGSHTNEEVAAYMNITREGLRLISNKCESVLERELEVLLNDED